MVGLNDSVFSVVVWVVGMLYVVVGLGFGLRCLTMVCDLCFWGWLWCLSLLVSCGVGII